MSPKTAMFLIVLCGGLYCMPAHANCKVANETQQCLGCANQIVEFKETKTGTKIAGTVYMSANSEPFESVLVEVFTRPENAVPLWNLEAASLRTRVAACFVEKDGKFRFRLRPGKYEMRFSRSSEWNCTYLKIEVREDLRTRKLRILMDIGT